MIITQSSMIFWLKFWSFDKDRSFPNVFVDCVVLGWLKPTKLCRMVKIMLQFDMTLLFNDADVKVVSSYGSIYTRFQNFCTNNKKNPTKKRFLLLNWTDKTNFLVLIYWITFEYAIYDWFELKTLLFMKFTQSNMIFWRKLRNFNQYRSFPNVFVDCVVLGWLKPTKLCRMVKIMLQFAVTLFLGNANVVFVGWCGSIYTRFQNVCTKVNEILNEYEFFCWIEQIKQPFWVWNNDSRSYRWFMIGLSWQFCCSWYLRNQIWVFDSNFEVLTSTWSFPNVFVDCVVLGSLKPNKLFKMVKIMIQLAITLFLGNANVVFVSWWVSICARFQNFCRNDMEILQKFGFCWWIEQIKQTF